MSKSLVETAKFIQHHLPGLDAGEYAVEVSHEFTADKIPGGKDVTTPMLYKFAVQGPRFKIEPTVVHSMYPPDGSAGEFSNVLPHIVLTNETLPWSRKPVRPDGKTDLDYGTFKDGSENYDLDVPSWLAVLLLHEEDFKDTGYDLKLDTNSKIGSFFGASTGAFISPAIGEDINNQPPWINPNEACQAIKIPIKLFSQIAPSMADLFVMGSVRKVAMGNKPTQVGADVADEGTYSVVMGNRIAKAGQRHLAVLVSLENMQDYLPDHNGTPSTKIPGSAKYAYLPVLASWNFISTGDTYKFDHLLESLNGRDQKEEPLPEPRLKMYPPPGTKAPTGPAGDAINLGYIPIKHTTRNNVTTASWYRGPLAPYAFDKETAQKAINIFKTNKKGNAVPAIYDADALVRLNPNTGLFDLSYASAWQLGRLLALQDKNFSIKLYQWKRQATGEAIHALEASIIDDQFSEILKMQEDAKETKQQSLLKNTMAQLIKQTPKTNT